MRLPLQFLPAAVLGMALLAPCNTTTFEVPKIGSRFEDTKKYLEYDTSLNMYVIPLENYKTLEYEHFELTIPEDDVVEYYAPAGSNSSNHAELYVRNLPVQTDFFGRAIYAQNQEGWNTLADVQKFSGHRIVDSADVCYAVGYACNIAGGISRFIADHFLVVGIDVLLQFNGNVVQVVVLLFQQTAS